MLDGTAPHGIEPAQHSSPASNATEPSAPHMSLYGRFNLIPRSGLLVGRNAEPEAVNNDEISAKCLVAALSFFLVAKVMKRERFHPPPPFVSNSDRCAREWDRVEIWLLLCSHSFHHFILRLGAPLVPNSAPHPSTVRVHHCCSIFIARLGTSRRFGHRFELALTETLTLGRHGLSITRRTLGRSSLCRSLPPSSTNFSDG